MLPGLFENGGVYCHATGFKILMDCKVGRASKALQTLKKIMPDSEKNPSSRSVLNLMSLPIATLHIQDITESLISPGPREHLSGA